LIRNRVGQALCGRLLGRYRCIRRAYNVDARVGAGGRVQDDLPGCRLDQLVACAKGPALTSNRPVATDTQADDVVI
jgi:hypothetical protein